MLKFKLSEVSFTFSKVHLRVMKRLTNVCHLTEEQLSWNLFCNDSLIAFWISYPFPSLFISPLFFPHFLEKSYHPFCNKIPTFVCICYRSVCVCVCVCVWQAQSPLPSHQHSNFSAFQLLCRGSPLPLAGAYAVLQLAYAVHSQCWGKTTKLKENQPLRSLCRITIFKFSLFVQK